MKRFILLFLLIPFIGYSQINNDKMIIATSFLSGFSSGLHEAIQANHFGSGNQFWDNKISWENKYMADNKTPRFPLSTSVLVFSTDGYHLTNFITNIANIGTLTISICSKDKRQWKEVIKKLLISVISNRAAFYLSYNVIFKK